MTEKKSRNKKIERNAICNCLLTMLVILRKIYDGVVDFIFAFLYRNVPIKKIPPASNPLLKESAISLAEKIRNQQISSVEVVEIFIQRVKEVNAIINAVVHERFEKALEEATQVDRLIQSGTTTADSLKLKQPFLGVPFTSKESTAAEGMSWSFGLVSRRGTLATEDAYIVKRMKQTGAILIGITNVPELNLWVETRNNVYGQTNNPYNTNRICGGSSGGEASIVTVCGTPVGLGTDIGGSTRLPAYFCGVYGHKLTGGLINTKGMTFRSGLESHTIVSAGPITRFAADLKPLSVALVLTDKLPLLSLENEVNPKILNYFYVEEPGDRRISPIGVECRSALRRVVDVLQENVESIHVPQKVHFPGFKYSYSLWRYWMSKESSNFASDLNNQQEPANGIVELPKKILGVSNFSLASVLNLLNLYMPMPSSEWAENETKNLRHQLLEKLGDDGVLLFPSYPTAAPYHYLPFLRPYNFAYWAIFNALQLPVTQIPVGLNKDGLPLGIQIVAGPHQDKLCFAVAEYLETLIGGWIPPFTS